MIRRTAPAVSFTPSHRALMIRSSRPLLSGEMTSCERLRASWNEIPFTLWGLSKSENFAYHWRIRYDLGLRDMKTFSKLRLYWFYAAMIVCTAAFWRICLLALWTFPYYQAFPEYTTKEGAAEVAKSWGKDVWCADGKFVTPYFHINPPMLTMTMDEL